MLDFHPKEIYSKGLWKGTEYINKAYWNWINFFAILKIEVGSKNDIKKFNDLSTIG